MKDGAVLKHACKSFEEDLVLHYYGENSEADRVRVGQHLEECPCCRSFIDDLRRLLPRMAREQERPQAFWDDYYRETLMKLAAQSERKHWWQDLLNPLKMWGVPAFGTIAVVVLAVGLVLGRSHLNFFSDKPAPSIPQEIMVDADQLEFFRALDMLESLSLPEVPEGKVLEPKTNHSSVGEIGQGTA